MKLVAAILAAAAIGANASCPNMCSGHGSCTTDDQCRCWKGYSGYDCSGRSCPVVEAWANNDAEGLHTYAECANAGICDRSSGECACFAGYEGRGCERSSCPNGCSGNGICRVGDDLPDYVAGSHAAQGTDPTWDMKAISACVCDGGFSGADCSQRVCPFGDDPMTVCEESNTEQIQQVTMGWPAKFDTATTAAVNDAAIRNTDFALRFTSYAGETFYTDSFTGLSSVASVLDTTLPVADTAGMTSALEALPNSRVKDVTVSAVTADQTSAASVAWKVTFHHEDSGNSYGVQKALKCPHTRNVGSGYDTFGCGAAGCQPMIKQPYAMTQLVKAAHASEDIAAESVNVYDNVIVPANIGTLWSSGTETDTPFAIFTDDSVLTCPTGGSCTSSATVPAGYVAIQAKCTNFAVTCQEAALFAQGSNGAPASGNTGAARLNAAATASNGYTFMGYYTDLAADKVLDIGAIMPDTKVEISSALLSMSTGLAAVDDAYTTIIMFHPPTCTDGADVTNAATGLNGDVENIECSGRGECDRSAGVCSCFSGYHGNNCGKQTVLV